MMEESAGACVSGKFAEALEKGKEAVSQAYCCAVTYLSRGINVCVFTLQSSKADVCH